MDNHANHEAGGEQFQRTGDWRFTVGFFFCLIFTPPAFFWLARHHGETAKLHMAMQDIRG